MLPWIGLARASTITNITLAAASYSTSSCRNGQRAFEGMQDSNSIPYPTYTNSVSTVSLSKWWQGNIYFWKPLHVGYSLTDMILAIMNHGSCLKVRFFPCSWRSSEGTVRVTELNQTRYLMSLYGQGYVGYASEFEPTAKGTSGQTYISHFSVQIKTAHLQNKRLMMEMKLGSWHFPCSVHFIRFVQ